MRARLYLVSCFIVLLAAAGSKPSIAYQPGTQNSSQGSAAQSQSSGIGSGSQADASRAQNEKNKRYAVIQGTVFDNRQLSVFGVRIKIRKAEEKKARWEVYSDHSGEFAQRVPPGPAEYVVWADVKTANGDPKPEKTVHIYGDELTTVFLHLDASEMPGGKKQ